MTLESLPVKAARADSEGIMDALDLLTANPEDARQVGQLLRERPQAVIRRVLALNPYQRAGLAEMTDDEVSELVAPVVEILASADPERLRGVRLVEQVVRQSPLKIKCHIEIDW